MTAPPEPELSEAQVRAGYPELTRCVHCGVLDPATERVIIADEGAVLLTVWLHVNCRAHWKPPQPLQYQHSGRYRVPYRPVVPLPPRG